MSYSLVQFVEDGLYHVCPNSNVRICADEPGLVTAKYKGIFFRAFVISEGDKNKMEVLKERCQLKDSFREKYKITSPSPCHSKASNSPLSSNIENFKRNLFPSTSTSASTITELQNVTVNQSRPTEMEDRQESYQSNMPVWRGKEQLHHELEDVDLFVTQAYVGEETDKELGGKELSEKSCERVGRESGGEVVEDNVADREENKTESNPKKGKQYYCPYCKSLYKQFGRHIFQVHGGEKEVDAIKNFDKKNPEKRRVISQLRAKGSRMFNALQSSPQKVILPRRVKEFNVADFIQCYLCGNTYKKRFLHRHVKRCPNSDGSSKQALKIAKQHLYRTDEEDLVIKFSEDVVSGIREGDIKSSIESDPLLKEYGKYLCTYYGTDRHLINLIRRKLRQVSEVFIKMQDIDNDIKKLEDVFQARKKHSLFTAVKLVTGFEKGIVKRPAMANEMATLLKQCARRRIIQAQECDDDETVKKINKWLEVIKDDYNTFIGKHARRTLDEKQWNKPKTLPLTEDILKLNVHVKEVSTKAKERLKEEFSFPEWTNLNKATMTALLSFNRKRVGDVQRIRIDELKKAHDVQKDSVVYEMMSESEKVHCLKYKRIETRGKRARGVPVLLTKDMLDSMKLIVQLRSQAQIPNENPYVFAQDKERPFSTAVALRETAYACGARNPNLLTGTKMRKQIATATQAFNFSTNDLSILATFLGHSLQTHSNFYRMPDEALQLAKISVVLEAIDSGKISDLKGKSLAELEEVVAKFMKEEDETVEQDIHQMPDLQQKVKRTPKKLIKVIRKTWTTPERSVMRKYFKHHLQNETLPTPMECHEAKHKFSPLKSRTVAQIKAWVNNQNKKSKK